MVRIREFLNTSSPEPGDRTAAYEAPAEPSKPLQKAASAPLSPQPQEAEGLYGRMLAECEDALQSVEHGEGVRLNRLPQCAEALAGLAPAQEESLMACCFDPSAPYSLARHSANVAVLLVRLGKAMDFGESFVRDLALLGCLHDVGMVSVKSVVSQNQRLDAGQRQAMQRHPLRGRELLNANRDLPGFVGEIAALEHERDDGSGYPHHLSGKSLNEHGQMLGMVDMFEALTHDRPFRARLSPASAFKVILDGHRGLFKNDLLRNFVDNVPTFPPGTLVELNTREVAQVIRSGAGALFSPVVRLYRESSRGLELSAYYLDLSAEPRRHIVRELEALPCDVS